MRNVSCHLPYPRLASFCFRSGREGDMGAQLALQSTWTRLNGGRAVLFSRRSCRNARTPLQLIALERRMRFHFTAAAAIVDMIAGLPFEKEASQEINRAAQKRRKGTSKPASNRGSTERKKETDVCSREFARISQAGSLLVGFGRSESSHCLPCIMHMPCIQEASLQIRPFLGNVAPEQMPHLLVRLSYASAASVSPIDGHLRGSDGTSQDAAAFLRRPFYGPNWRGVLRFMRRSSRAATRRIPTSSIFAGRFWIEQRAYI